jgi:hypothetical protein
MKRDARHVDANAIFRCEGNPQLILDNYRRIVPANEARFSGDV